MEIVNIKVPVYFRSSSTSTESLEYECEYSKEYTRILNSRTPSLVITASCDCYYSSAWCTCKYFAATV